jgi:glycine dehydrogenase subunit 1
LLAIGITAYLSLLGPAGLRDVARQSHAKAVYAADRLAELPGYQVITPRPFYNEFALHTPSEASNLQQRLVDQHLLAGVPIGADYPDLSQALLLAFTEQNTKEEIDRLVEALRDA